MERSPLRVWKPVSLLLVCAVMVAQACVMATTKGPPGSAPDGSVGSTGGNGGTGTGSGGTVDVMPARPCQGLECQRTTCTGPGCTVPQCPTGQRTSITGTVYDPAGKVPLYNVQVYVPNGPLGPLTEGPTCDRCESNISGNPVSAVLTDARGNFVLENPPVGASIPLVIQVGKWRRELKVPVAACVQNQQMDKNVTRLPRNQTEGHIPKIALTTGSADALECLLRKIGLEDSEFTPETGMGRVNLFNGTGGTDRYDTTRNAGAIFTDAAVWWETGANLNKYDIVLHSCEGTENPDNKSMPARQALLDYANAGGRVFASHWHNYWFEFGPAPFPTVATFNHANIANSIVSTIDTSFPKGIALADWLVNVGASTMRGQLPIAGAKHTVDAVNPMLAQRWIYNEMPTSVQYLTANTPIGSAAANQCGRVVFSDIHVSSGVGDRSAAGPANPLGGRNGGAPFPSGCTTTDLSPQEKALEFMLFDLSSCIVPDSPPIP